MRIPELCSKMIMLNFSVPLHLISDSIFTAQVFSIRFATLSYSFSLIIPDSFSSFFLQTKFVIGQHMIIDYILITNFMHWLLFIYKILFSPTCFEPQVLIFRRIQLYTCSIWYCHSLWQFVVACWYAARVRTDCRGKVVGRAS